MAAIASFLFAHENGQCQSTLTPQNTYIIGLPGFKGFLKGDVAQWLERVTVSPVMHAFQVQKRPRRVKVETSVSTSIRAEPRAARSSHISE